MFRCMLALLVLLVWLSPVQAQYTYVTLDLPAPEGGPLQLLDVTNDDHLLGNGRLNAQRILPSRMLQLISCLPGVFQPSPTALRQGPNVAAMNNGRTVVGEHVGVKGLFAFVQNVAGDCQFFRVPGSVNTRLTAIADNEWKAGVYDNPIELEPGVSRRHGFLQAPDGSITTLTGWAPGDVLNPEGLNLVGDMVGHALINVQPNNSSEYTAFYRKADGTLLALNDPNGHDLWCPAGLNNPGQTACVTAQQAGVSGGAAWLVDLTVSPPAFTPLNLPTAASLFVVPRGINDQGWLVGFYAERLGPPCQAPSPCQAFHQFLAVPSAAPPPRPKKTERPKPKQRFVVQDWRDDHRDAHDHDWRPVWKDGKVVWSNGEEIVEE